MSVESVPKACGARGFGEKHTADEAFLTTPRVRAGGPPPQRVAAPTFRSRVAAAAATSPTTAAPGPARDVAAGGLAGRRLGAGPRGAPSRLGAGPRGAPSRLGAGP